MPSNPKPGYKTTEFWISVVATVAGLVIASGAVATESTAARIVGAVISLLTTLGYQAQRTALKR